MRYVRGVILSMGALLLTGCPKECKKQSDCGKGEGACMAFYDADDENNEHPRYYCSETVQVGDQGSGFEVTKIEVGTDGAKVTVEPKR